MSDKSPCNYCGHGPADDQEFADMIAKLETDNRKHIEKARLEIGRRVVIQLEQTRLEAALTAIANHWYHSGKKTVPEWAQIAIDAISTTQEDKSDA